MLRHSNEYSIPKLLVSAVHIYNVALIKANRDIITALKNTWLIDKCSVPVVKFARNFQRRQRLLRIIAFYIRYVCDRNCNPEHHTIGFRTDSNAQSSQLARSRELAISALIARANEILIIQGPSSDKSERHFQLLIICRLCYDAVELQSTTLSVLSLPRWHDDLCHHISTTEMLWSQAQHRRSRVVDSD